VALVARDQRHFLFERLQFTSGMVRAVPHPIVRIGDGAPRTDQDLVAVEAPLGVEIRLAGTGETKPVGILMRTPGDDPDLIRGWLATERIAAADEIAGVEFLTAGDPPGDIARVTVTTAVAIAAIVDRWTLTPTSACGLCGRLGIDALPPVHSSRGAGRPVWAAAVIASLPGRLRPAQTVFAETGGLHAAGLFDAAGGLCLIREDIGRHNAVDKVIGAWLADPEGDLASHVLVVSGRAAFEIVQKAAVAGIGAVVAVGAPSTLAVQAARATGLTLAGFAREGRFNVYSGADRVI
jgi:FdhD protein